MGCGARGGSFDCAAHGGAVRYFAHTVRYFAQADGLISQDGFDARADGLILWGVRFECGALELGLGFVEGDVGDVGLRGGEIYLELSWGVVAPGAGGVEVGDELGREFGGDGFAAELGGEGVGEVLKEGEADEDGVAGRPVGGLVAEEAELEGEVIALESDGGVDAAGVEIEPVHLVGGEGGDGVLGGGAEEEGALGAVVAEHGVAEDFGEGTGGVAAEELHLPEAVLCGDEALGDDGVVEGGGGDVGHAVGVALDGDGAEEVGDVEDSVELGERGTHNATHPDARADEGDGGEDDEGEEGRGEELAEEGATAWCGDCCGVGVGVVHALGRV